MSKRLILSKLMILVIVLMSLPLSHAQTTTQNDSLRISAYKDDPFVGEAALGRLNTSAFQQDNNGIIYLSNIWVYIDDEQIVYRQDKTTGEYKPFARNPWPLPTANDDGNFKFQDEARFPHGSRSTVTSE
jgi:hypothetical protein